MHSAVQFVFQEATDLVRSVWTYDDPHTSWRARCWLIKSIECFARDMHTHGTLTVRRQRELGSALKFMQMNTTAAEHWNGLIETLVSINQALAPDNMPSKQRSTNFNIDAFLADAKKCHNTLPVWFGKRKPSAA